MRWLGREPSSVRCGAGCWHAMRLPIGGSDPAVAAPGGSRKCGDARAWLHGLRGGAGTSASGSDPSEALRAEHGTGTHGMRCRGTARVVPLAIRGLRRPSGAGSVPRAGCAGDGMSVRVELGSSPLLAMECRKGVAEADGTAMGRQVGEVAGWGVGRAGSTPDTGSRAAMRWNGEARLRRLAPGTEAHSRGTRWEGTARDRELDESDILAGARGQRMQRGGRVGSGIRNEVAATGAQAGWRTGSDGRWRSGNRGCPEASRRNGIRDAQAEAWHGDTRTTGARMIRIACRVATLRGSGSRSLCVRTGDVVRRARPADDDWNASARHASDRTRVARVASARQSDRAVADDRVRGERLCRGSRMRRLRDACWRGAPRTQ